MCHNTRSRKPRRDLVQLDALEARRLLAAQGIALESDGTLRITGTTGLDQIELVGGDADGAIHVRLNDRSASFPREQVLRISVTGDEGDDQFAVRGAGTPAQINVEGGVGRDVLTVGAVASPAAEAFPVHFDGGADEDEIVVRGTAADDAFDVRNTSSTGTYVTMIRGGAYRVTTPMWGNAGRVERARLETGGGDDVLRVDGDNAFDAVAVDAGDGDDVLTLVNRNDYQLDLRLGADADDRDTLNVGESDGGRFRLGYDLGTLSPHLSVKFDTSIVNLDVPQHVAALEIASRTTVSLNMKGATAITTGKFSMAPGTFLNLSANDLLVHAQPDSWQAARDALEALVAASRNSPAGLWRGSGLTASAGRTEPLKGLVVHADDRADLPFVPVRVRFSWNGDANLDGRINADDYFRIDRGFLSQPPNPTYDQGDFNYDNLVNADDYFLIDQAFLGQSGVAATLASSRSVAVTTPSVSTAATTVSRRTEPDHRLFNATRRIRSVRRLR